jgi:phytoene dehydrogenase-like protein
MEQIYRLFPEEKEAIDHYLTLSNRGMLFVKLFLFARLLPRTLQRLFWFFVPSSIMQVVEKTAKDILPTFIKNKKLISLFSSMWIDTGCRPDKSSFFLTASVFRGIPLEGGCYPKGGSTEMAKEIVTVIEVRLLSFPFLHVSPLILLVCPVLVFSFFYRRMVANV